MTTNATAVETTVTTDARQAARQVRNLCSEFYSDVRQISPKGLLSFGSVSDGDGADFGFSLEVRPSEYEDVVRKTSALERQYFFEHGVNFLIDVRTL